MTFGIPVSNRFVAILAAVAALSALLFVASWPTLLRLMSPSLDAASCEATITKALNLTKTIPAAPGLVLTVPAAYHPSDRWLNQPDDQFFWEAKETSVYSNPFPVLQIARADDIASEAEFCEKCKGEWNAGVCHSRYSLDESPLHKSEGTRWCANLADGFSETGRLVMSALVWGSPYSYYVTYDQAPGFEQIRASLLFQPQLR